MVVEKERGNRGAREGRKEGSDGIGARGRGEGAGREGGEWGK